MSTSQKATTSPNQNKLKLENFANYVEAATSNVDANLLPPRPDEAPKPIGGSSNNSSSPTKISTDPVSTKNSISQAPVATTNAGAEKKKKQQNNNTQQQRDTAAAAASAKFTTGKQQQTAPYRGGQQIQTRSVSGKNVKKPSGTPPSGSSSNNGIAHKSSSSSSKSVPKFARPLSVSRSLTSSSKPARTTISSSSNNNRLASGNSNTSNNNNNEIPLTPRTKRRLSKNKDSPPLDKSPKRTNLSVQFQRDNASSTNNNNNNNNRERATKQRSKSTPTGPPFPLNPDAGIQMAIFDQDDNNGTNRLSKFAPLAESDAESESADPDAAASDAAITVGSNSSVVESGGEDDGMESLDWDSEANSTIVSFIRPSDYEGLESVSGSQETAATDFSQGPTTNKLYEHFVLQNLADQYAGTPANETPTQTATVAAATSSALDPVQNLQLAINSIPVMANIESALSHITPALEQLLQHRQLQQATLTQPPLMAQQQLLPPPQQQQLQQQSSSQSDAPRLRIATKPPAICLKEIPNLRTLLKTITQTVKTEQFLVKTSLGDITRLYARDHAMHAEIVRILFKNKTEFYTYQSKMDRVYKISIKGLHSSTTEEEIRDALNDNGFKVQHSFCPKHRLTGKRMNMFLVNLFPTENVKDIHNLKRLLGQIIEIEPVQQRAVVIQCHNCQDYGHTEKYCTNPPICANCGQNHHTKNCVTLDAMYCHHCKNSNHKANSPECQFFKRELALVKERNAKMRIRESNRPPMPKRKRKRRTRRRPNVADASNNNTTATAAAPISGTMPPVPNALATTISRGQNTYADAAKRGQQHTRSTTTTNSSSSANSAPENNTRRSSNKNKQMKPIYAHPNQQQQQLQRNHQSAPRSRPTNQQNDHHQQHLAQHGGHQTAGQQRKQQQQQKNQQPTPRSRPTNTQNDHQHSQPPAHRGGHQIAIAEQGSTPRDTRQQQHPVQQQLPPSTNVAAVNSIPDWLPLFADLVQKMLCGLEEFQRRQQELYPAPISPGAVNQSSPPDWLQQFTAPIAQMQKDISILTQFMVNTCNSTDPKNQNGQNSL